MAYPYNGQLSANVGGGLGGLPFRKSISSGATTTSSKKRFLNIISSSKATISTGTLANQTLLGIVRLNNTRFCVPSAFSKIYTIDISGESLSVSSSSLILNSHSTTVRCSDSKFAAFYTDNVVRGYSVTTDGTVTNTFNYTIPTSGTLSSGQSYTGFNTSNMGNLSKQDSYPLFSTTTEEVIVFGYCTISAQNYNLCAFVISSSGSLVRSFFIKNIGSSLTVKGVSFYNLGSTYGLVFSTAEPANNTIEFFNISYDFLTVTNPVTSSITVGGTDTGVVAFALKSDTLVTLTISHNAGTYYAKKISCAIENGAFTNLFGTSVNSDTSSIEPANFLNRPIVYGVDPINGYLIPYATNNDNRIHAIKKPTGESSIFVTPCKFIYYAESLSNGAILECFDSDFYLVEGNSSSANNIGMMQTAFVINDSYVLAIGNDEVSSTYYLKAALYK